MVRASHPEIPIASAANHATGAIMATKPTVADHPKKMPLAGLPIKCVHAVASAVGCAEQEIEQPNVCDFKMSISSGDRDKAKRQTR
jgi:hypothetical protein